MTTVLLSAFLAVGAPDAAAPMPKIEGKWRIVYAEEGGRRNTAWEEVVATGSDYTLTYEKEGKKRSLQMKFGPHQTVKGTFGGTDGERGGVYVAAKDYFIISLGAGKGGSSGSFILILRRAK